MLFSELYSAYYNTVAEILKAAVVHPLQSSEVYRIVAEHAFGESVLNILPALKEERWQLIKEDGTTPLKNIPSMPLTILEKRWLKAIGNDPRVRLFTDASLDFPEVEPLFLPEDVQIFDRYLDGDDYEDEAYIRNFRQILDAIRNRYPISIEMLNRRDEAVSQVVMPEYLEYSEKDDKFRLIGWGSKFGSTVNLGRIISCQPYDQPYKESQKGKIAAQPRSVIFELVDERSALERVLLHFAHFEKQAEKLSEKRYRITVIYDKGDETEMVIRILSFGPMIHVTAPTHFVNLMKERLTAQKNCRC